MSKGRKFAGVVGAIWGIVGLMSAGIGETWEGVPMGVGPRRDSRSSTIQHEIGRGFSVLRSSGDVNPRSEASSD